MKRHSIETLESRRLLSGVSLATDGILNVIGTTGNDTVRLVSIPATATAAARWSVQFNGTSRSYVATQVKRCNATGAAGQDVIDFAAATFPTTLSGDDGNDT